MLTLHPDSHLDHVSKGVVDYVLKTYAHLDKFTIDTFELPEHLGTLSNSLYGPAVGDDPVNEDVVTYGRRGGREIVSRLVDRPARPTRTCTLICGESGPGKGDCVLYTVFGGPLAPREPGDPALPPEQREASEAFWREHALAKA